MAAYIPVPRDLTRVKSKILFNLTKRQLICFGAGALIGVPSFFLLKTLGTTSMAVICMMVIMLPFFFLGIYEKDGQPLEKIAKQAKRTKRVGASSRVRGRELSYEVRSIRLHHPMSGLNLPPFSAARAFCISPQYFHPLALPLTVPLQKAALVSACSTTRKPLLFVFLCLDLYDL